MIILVLISELLPFLYFWVILVTNDLNLFYLDFFKTLQLLLPRYIICICIMYNSAIILGTFYYHILAFQFFGLKDCFKASWLLSPLISHKNVNCLSFLKKLHIQLFFFLSTLAKKYKQVNNFFGHFYKEFGDLL